MLGRETTHNIDDIQFDVFLFFLLYPAQQEKALRAAK
jgi:hypothetical protein